MDTSAFDAERYLKNRNIMHCLLWAGAGLTICNTRMELKKQNFVVLNKRKVRNLCKFPELVWGGGGGVDSIIH